MNFPIISSLILLPSIGALFLFFVNSKNITSIKYVSLFVSIINFLLSVYLWLIFDQYSYEFQFVESRVWIKDFINYKVGVDGISILFIVLTAFITSLMMVVVTLVSALVHIYSIGYMSHDPHKPRFMAYLSLFTFAMLMLVTSDNFIQLFFGWEGVGLCSYFLIGFWFKKESANAAATVRINKVKTCPVKSPKNIEKETKLMFTASKINSILINITMMFFLLRKIPIIPIEKITAPRVK